jgi:hypothetical protein
LNDLPNVLWIVSEEAPADSTWWNNHQIAHIRAYEAGKQLQHPIGYAGLIGAPDTVIYNSDADWVAPAARVSPATSCGGGHPPCKVNVNDSDHSYWEIWKETAQQNRNYAWQNFMTGNQVLFMDPYLVYYPRESRNLCPSPTNTICNGPDTRWDNFRDNLGHILRYSRTLNLARVMPRGSLSSTGYCLAQTPSIGAEYLVYAPSGGSFTVNLSAMSGSRTLSVEWFNPSTGVAVAADPIAAGSSSQSFSPPFGGDAALYLVDTAGNGFAAARGLKQTPVTGSPDVLIDRRGVGIRVVGVERPDPGAPQRFDREVLAERRGWECDQQRAHGNGVEKCERKSGVLQIPSIGVECAGIAAGGGIPGIEHQRTPKLPPRPEQLHRGVPIKAQHARIGMHQGGYVLESGFQVAFHPLP